MIFYAILFCGIHLMKNDLHAKWIYTISNILFILIGT